jgi:hypothetical protein
MTRLTRPRRRISPETWIALLFLGIALLMLVAATVSGVHVARISAREVRSPGVVTALTARPDAGGDFLYYPVVTFTLPDGARHTAQLATGSRPPAHKVDQAVIVIYDPAQPDHARIASWFNLSDLWILPAITGGLGVAFLLATGLAWWIGRQFS